MANRKFSDIECVAVWWVLGSDGIVNSFRNRNMWTDLLKPRIDWNETPEAIRCWLRISFFFFFRFFFRNKNKRNVCVDLNAMSTFFFFFIVRRTQSQSICHRVYLAERCNHMISTILIRKNNNYLAVTVGSISVQLTEKSISNLLQKKKKKNLLIALRLHRFLPEVCKLSEISLWMHLPKICVSNSFEW